jgi:hypothetical protein
VVVLKSCGFSFELRNFLSVHESLSLELLVQTLDLVIAQSDGVMHFILIGK